MQLGDAFAQLALDLHVAARALDPLLSRTQIELTAAAFEQCRQLWGDDRIHAAGIGAHSVELAKCPENVLTMTTSRVDGMPDDDLALFLPMAVDAAVALLHHIRVVRNFDVD